MSALRVLYLALAVLGLAGQAVLFFRTGHPGIPVAAANWDHLTAVAALSLWVLAETWVRRNWIALVAIPLACLVGLGCGLPLYLFLRTRPVS